MCRYGLSPSAETLPLKEGTWRAVYDRSRTKLFTLLGDALGSQQAAGQAFEAIFVLYAKECVARSNTPSDTALLRRTVQWVRAQGSACESPDSDFHRIVGLLPVDFRLAFLVTYSLQLEPEEAEDVLEQSREEISLKARAALQTIRQIQKAEAVRR